MIDYRCPRCETAHQSEDRWAGHKTHCGVCGQRLQIPPVALGKTTLAPPNQTILARHIEPDIPAVRYAGQSWLPAWIWHPTRVDPPENSGETIVRFICNILRALLAILVVKWLLILVLFLIVGIIFACSGGKI